MCDCIFAIGFAPRKASLMLISKTVKLEVDAKICQ
jgi:hypothetical protein